MNIYVLGVNYKTTPIEIREKLSFSEEFLIKSLKEIKLNFGVKECILLSTCNRTELYIYSGEEILDRCYIENILCNIKRLDSSIFRKYFYFYSSDNAIYHPFKVAVGLDSMVLGEDQVLGQFKQAHKIAMECKTSGAILNTLFRDAVTSAKNIKTNTEISKIPISVTSIALHNTSNIFNGLKDKYILIIGLGITGALTVNQLKDYGVKKIYVTNRTHGKAETIAKMYDYVEFIEYNKRYDYIDRCDVIISSTSSPHYTITADLAKNAITTYKKRVFLDLAVPRDIDEDIKLIYNAKYINIDNLNTQLQYNQNKRFIEIDKAEGIIQKYISEFNRWLKRRVKTIGVGV